MDDVDIELALQGGEVENGRRCYEPGSTVQGWTQLRPHGPVDCHRVVARLEWHTEGHGVTDQECVDEIELVSGRLSGPLVRNFTLTVPQQPWSYTGRYINIRWRVLVVVVAKPLDVSEMFNVDPSAEAPIVVAPRRAAMLPTVSRASVPPDVVPPDVVPPDVVPPDVRRSRRAKKRR
jgi:hypothetical protein